jgi:hypothetical protein
VCRGEGRETVDVNVDGVVVADPTLDREGGVVGAVAGVRVISVPV